MSVHRNIPVQPNRITSIVAQLQSKIDAENGQIQNSNAASKIIDQSIEQPKVLAENIVKSQHDSKSGNCGDGDAERSKLKKWDEVAENRESIATTQIVESPKERCLTLVSDTSPIQPSYRPCSNGIHDKKLSTEASINKAQKVIDVTAHDQINSVTISHNQFNSNNIESPIQGLKDSQATETNKNTDIQEGVIENIKTVMQRLQQVKKDQNTVLDRLLNVASGLHDGDKGDSLISEQSGRLLRSLKLIDLGIDDADLILSMSCHLQVFEAEAGKYRSSIKVLSEENRWLRDELASTQRKLQASEENVARLEVEKSHMEFMKSLEKYDGASSSAEQVTSSASSDEDCTDYPDSLTSPLPNAEAQSHCEGSGDGDTHDLHTLQNLAIQYATRGQAELAVPLCKRALNALEKKSGRDDPDVATMLNILALVYRDQNKFEEASTLLNDALSIRIKTLGRDHPAVAATLNNLAVLYCKQGKYGAAEPLCRRALEIREKVLGNTHPDVAKQLNNLALICQHLGKQEQVNVCYVRAAEIRERNCHRGADSNPNDSQEKRILASADFLLRKTEATNSQRVVQVESRSEASHQQEYTESHSDEPRRRSKVGHSEGSLDMCRKSGQPIYHRSSLQLRPVHSRSKSETWNSTRQNKQIYDVSCNSSCWSLTESSANRNRNTKPKRSSNARKKAAVTARSSSIRLSD